MRWILTAVALAWASGAAAQEAPAPIEVVVLGTYHFGNPGLDVHNARIDPVTTPDKQRELAELAERLARFRPTLVAVERIASDPVTLADPVYAAFKPADLATSTDERVQVGYRVAARMGLAKVYAIDEQAGAGEPDYFPFEKVQAWAEANGKSGTLESMIAEIGKTTAWLERAQRTTSVGDILATINAPDSFENLGGQRAFYYGLMAFGGADGLPGADLNARWYARNARIFAKLVRVAKPGDRVLVVYGSGHNYWLRHFAATTPGFRLVEAGGYLKP